MPFISVKTSSKLTLQQKQELNRGIGQIISILPGKAESNVMIEISDGHTLCYAGQERSGIAFVELRLFRESPTEAKEAFVEAFFKLLEEAAGIKPDDVYMNIMEFDHWVSRGKLK